MAVVPSNPQCLVCSGTAVQHRTWKFAAITLVELTTTVIFGFHRGSSGMHACVGPSCKQCKYAVKIIHAVSLQICSEQLLRSMYQGSILSQLIRFGDLAEFLQTQVAYCNSKASLVKGLGQLYSNQGRWKVLLTVEKTFKMCCYHCKILFICTEYLGAWSLEWVIHTDIFWLKTCKLQLSFRACCTHDVMLTLLDYFPNGSRVLSEKMLDACKLV